MKHPGRLLLVLALLSLPLGAANKVLPEPSHPQLQPVTAAQIIQSGSLGKVLLSYYSAAEIQKGVYIGAEYCLACHPSYAKFKDTRHASLLRRPMVEFTTIADKGVMADQNGNGKDDFIDGLDFNTISSPFDIYKPNAPKLSVKNGTYLVTIGTVDYPVVFTAGGSDGQDQRFAVRVPVTDTDTKFSKANYFAPLSWSAATKAWITNSPTGWYDANNKPKFSATTKSSELSAVSSHAGCVGCHVTGMRDYTALATGEKVYTGFAATLYAINNPSYFDYNGDGTFETVNITCESCHGPGSNHVLGGPNVPLIVNPAKLTGKQQTEVCQRCHSSLKSTPNSKWGWPCKDDQAGAPDWYPGAPGSLADWSKDGTAYWPDGVSVKSGHSYGFQKSLHSNNPYEIVSCTVCHDPHQKTANEFQLRDKMTSADGKTSFKTSNEDNTLCLSCHATHGPFANITQAMVADAAKNERRDRHGRLGAHAPPLRSRAADGPQQLRRLPHVDHGQPALVQGHGARGDPQVPGSGRPAELLRGRRGGRLPQPARQHLRPRAEERYDLEYDLRPGPRDDASEVLRAGRHVVEHHSEAGGDGGSQPLKAAFSLLPMRGGLPAPSLLDLVGRS